MKKKLISILAVISFFSIVNFTYAVSPEPIFFYDSGIGVITIADDYVGIGIATPRTTFVINGGQAVKRTAAGAADYAPSILTTDYIIAMDNTAAARACTISTEDEDTGTAANPRVFIIKDESGGCAANNITITLESGGTIDGAANFVMNQPYQSLTLYVDGTNAWIY